MYVPWLVHTRNTTHSYLFAVAHLYVCHDSFIRVCLWLIRVFVPWLIHMCVPWLIHMYVPWLIHMCVPWLIHMCVVTGAAGVVDKSAHSYVGAVTNSYMWHDANHVFVLWLGVTWHIHFCLPWCIHVCDVVIGAATAVVDRSAHPYVCAVAHLYVWHDSCVYLCHDYVWHDSFTCVYPCVWRNRCYYGRRRLVGSFKL